MAVTRSRRGVLHFGCGTAVALGVSALAPAGALGPVRALAQGAPASNASAEDLFYRDDWFGEPWRKPETAVLIHGNDESSIVWYAWMPRMAQEFRVLRPDVPGFGRSRIPAGFEWSLPSLAAVVAHVLDKAGIDSAHIIGAKAGGTIAMQFAADYPARTRTLSVASSPASVPASVRSSTSPSQVPQRDRLGSVASKEMVDYWDNMFKTAPEISTKGLLTAVSKLDLGRDGVLQRIKAPTLVMTADRSKTQSVEMVRQYQMLIPNSRLVVLRSDAYHIAAANADECVTNVLTFIKEAKHRG
jgi:pimeloyl-ACP methyl ester carboxylesterase